MSLSRPGSPGAQPTGDSIVGSFDERERKSIRHASYLKTFNSWESLNSWEEPETGIANEQLQSIDIMKDRAPPKSVPGRHWVHVDRVEFGELLCQPSRLVLLCRFEGHEVFSSNSARIWGARR